MCWKKYFLKTSKRKTLLDNNSLKNTSSVNQSEKRDKKVRLPRLIVSPHVLQHHSDILNVNYEHILYNVLAF